MTDRSDRHRRFTRRLLEAMGLGSLTGLALAGGACGGHVVLDTGSAGSGGTGSNAGGAGTGTGGIGTGTGIGGAGASVGETVGAGGVGPFQTVSVGPGGSVPGCNVAVSPPEQLIAACFIVETGECPAATEAQPTIAELLGDCDLSQNSCCGMPTIEQVVCGPNLSSGVVCCYNAVFTPTYECPLGRPFTASGEARTAPARARADWTASRAAPATASLDPITRRALAAAWARDARYEHASVASFARLALELLAVGAPADLVRDAQRAMGDEIRHAEIAFALAGAYAGAPVGPGPLSLDGALGRAALAEVAAAAVREGCVGETIAALVAAEAAELAEDEAVRAALGAVAAEEADHAAMSWRLVAWAYRTGGAEVREAVAAAFAEPADLGAEAAPEGVDAAAYRAHGRLLPADQRAIAARALADVVRPSAAALLGSPPPDPLDASA